MGFSLLISLVLSLSANSGAPEDLPLLIEETQKINELAPSKKGCDGEASGIPELGRSSQVFRAAQTCDLLFSPTPPPQFPWAGNVYFPFCSLDQLNTQLHDHPKYSPEEAWKKMRDWFVSLDSCTNPSQNRYSKTFKDDSQVDDGVVKMTKAERVKRAGEVKALLASEAGICCGSDAACQKLMKSVRLEWCVPQKDPKKPDPCVSDGTYFTSDLVDKTVDRLKKLEERKKLGLLRIDPGYIQLSPLVDSKDRSPTDSLSDIAHELGHACSWMKTQLRIVAGDLQMANAFVQEWEHDTETGAGCEMIPDVRHRYEYLFKSLGATSDTSNCFLGLATDIVDDRFRRGKCEHGCPIAVIDETVANYMSYVARSKAEGIASFAVNCNEYRDSEHPLGADSLVCAMKTPEVKERMYQWAGCSR
jgi:hypothetical protein